MESMGMVTDFISKPRVDSIIGLSPSISVDQHLTNRSPRATVGTSTEIYTYLRILFARLGERDCPGCGRRVLPLSNGGEDAASNISFEDESDEVFPCPYCGHGVPELSMSHFSFNKPQGVCPACTGLGTVYEADIDVLIDQSRSVNDGAVREWDIHYLKRNTETINAAGKHYGFKFDFDIWVKDLGQLQRDLLFYSVESYQFKRYFPDALVPDAASRGRFEGIATNVLRRYAEHADNINYREKMGKALVETECHECKGTRLKKYSRRVTVAGKSIVELSDMSLEKLSLWIEELPRKISKDAMVVAVP